MYFNSFIRLKSLAREREEKRRKEKKRKEDISPIAPSLKCTPKVLCPTFGVHFMEVAEEVEKPHTLCAVTWG